MRVCGEVSKNGKGDIFFSPSTVPDVYAFVRHKSCPSFELRVGCNADDDIRLHLSSIVHVYLYTFVIGY